MFALCFFFVSCFNLSKKKMLYVPIEIYAIRVQNSRFHILFRGKIYTARDKSIKVMRFKLIFWLFDWCLKKICFDGIELRHWVFREIVWSFSLASFFDGKFPWFGPVQKTLLLHPQSFNAKIFISIEIDVENWFSNARHKFKLELAHRLTQSINLCFYLILNACISLCKK